MTVPATTRKAGPYTGNGVQTVYPYAFKVFATTDVKVVRADLTGVETVLSSGYTVSMNADQVASPGGNVTLSAALTSGYKLTVLGALPYDQTLAIPGGGNYNPVAHENALDRLLEQIQQVKELTDRAVLVTSTSGQDPNALIASLLTASSAATSSAADAAASAASALAYLNTFKGQYYGPLAADPTLDPLGAAMGAGDLYWNTSSGAFKVYNGATWNAIAGGAVGSGVFYENAQTLIADYTLTAGMNAMSAGPITIATGVTVTIPTGATWSIV